MSDDIVFEFDENRRHNITVKEFLESHRGVATQLLYGEWTTTPPTEPGWYWAKEEDGDPECVLLQTRHGVATSEPFYVRAIGAEWDMRRTDFTHWLGPLPPPEAPKD